MGLTHGPGVALKSAATYEHGGPDGQGVPLHVQSCDASRYPDPAYTAVRQQLADFHGVQAWRVVLAGSASEFIHRITAWVVRQGGRQVSVPTHAYGDYTLAALAWGLAVGADASTADLVWCCEPASPLGGPHGLWPQALGESPLQPLQPLRATVVLDCAYAPLRLQGACSLNATQRSRFWQMFSPNKALGLTGVRAAYALAPLDAESAVLALNALAPSWVVGAHGVALLQAWVQPPVQTWLADSLHTLRLWKAKQIDMLTALGWTCLPSDANFFCAHPAMGEAGDSERMAWAAALVRLRHLGIKLRDTASFGLPGHARLGVLPPVAQEALRLALIHINPSAEPLAKMAGSTPSPDGLALSSL
jgi:histidinol-phosphate aminotransferase